jgi:hypothetical protein
LDLVTFWTVIEHLPLNGEMAALREINRTLKENGKLFMSTENSHALSKLFDPAYFLAGHRHYSGEQLAAYLKGSDFEVESHFIREGLFRCLSILLLYFSKHITRHPLRKDPFRHLSEREYLHNGFKTIFFSATKNKESALQR